MTDTSIGTKVPVVRITNRTPLAFVDERRTFVRRGG